jgi:hypothetical protein
MALERQLTGCTVSGRLGCGGESVCFAATVPPHKDVAVKVGLRGYSKADTLVEERAGVSHLHSSDALLAPSACNIRSENGLQQMYLVIAKDI